MSRDATPKPTSTNPLAATPPMGWNSWNAFRKEIDEERIRAQADAMVETGLRDAGYEYLVVDGGWRASERDADGNMQVNDDFPGGMAALADYVHDRGLKFGIHQSVGVKDCAGETPGTQSAPGGERQDAELFAEWGIDFLKYDLCLYEYPDSPADRRAVTRRAYERMGAALRATDREIVYSISEYGRYRPWLWAADAGAHTWRTSWDIRDRWESVMAILDKQVRLAEYAGPHHWNDPDMLQVGNGGMSVEEYRTHFSLWAMLAAPLFAGTDLTEMGAETREILTNEAVIAVDQDPAGFQAWKVRGAYQEAWAKPLADGDYAVLLFSRLGTDNVADVSAREIGMVDAEEYRVRDLWEGTEETTDGRIAATLDRGECEMYRVSPLEE